MRPHRHLELLNIEGGRLASVPEAALDAPVPGLPNWTVERVLRHTGKVHRWVSAALGAGPDADPPPITSLPRGAAAIEAYREALTDVTALLGRLDPDEPAWTFQGTGDVAFWCRRQAHEVAVHRIDAADAISAAGGSDPEPIAVDGAVDGIDEWLRVFLANHWAARGERPPLDLRGTIHLHGTDDDPGPVPAEWLVTIDETIEIERLHVKGDAALRGAAPEIFLTLWRRRPLENLESHGDADLVRRVLDTVRV